MACQKFSHSRLTLPVPQVTCGRFPAFKNGSYQQQSTPPFKLMKKWREPHVLSLECVGLEMPSILKWRNVTPLRCVWPRRIQLLHIRLTLIEHGTDSYSKAMEEYGWLNLSESKSELTECKSSIHTLMKLTAAFTLTQPHTCMRCQNCAQQSTDECEKPVTRHGHQGSKWHVSTLWKCWVWSGGLG